MLIGDHATQSRHRQSYSSAQETHPRGRQQSKSFANGANGGRVRESGDRSPAKTERVDFEIKKQQFYD